MSLCITITCPCNGYPYTPLLYTKIGVDRGMHLFPLFLLWDMDCGCSLESLHSGGSSVRPQSVFLGGNEKDIIIFPLKINILQP